ncbi:MAG TPA: UPF0182 family protein [Clostridia bacterium]|nr:UPF0182 family protein [Clostridia bacterium]
MQGRRTFILGIAIILAVLIAVTLSAGFITEYWWFESLGFSQVFRTNILAKLGTGLVFGLIFTGVILVNVVVSKRGRRVLYVGIGETTQRIDLPRRTNLYLVVLALIFGGLAGLNVSGEWLTVLRYLHRVPFGIQDPFFGRDVGFYIFNLPLLELVYQFLFATLLLTLALTLGVYFLTGSATWDNTLILERGARRHLSVLVGLLFALKGAGYQLGIYRLLYSPRGVAFGASYTDIHAQLPALRVLIVVALAAAVLAIANGFRRDFRLLGIAVGALALCSLVLGTGYPAFVQQFEVEPDEISKERPYIEQNIKYTTLAYGLDKVVERHHPATVTLTREIIDRNEPTIENIRLWDWRALKDTYSQLQEIRLYYRFNDIDTVRYNVDGRYTQVFMAARELDQSRLASTAQTWMNLHLKFTHGYGIVANPSSAVSAEGLPVFLVRDIPPRSTTPVLEVKRPEIYYGELTDSYAIVNTKEPEFDYPLGDDNRYTHYSGKGGVKLDSFLKKVLFSIRLGSYKVLLTEAITPESRVMIHRQIEECVSTLAPFLMFDGDPYIIVSGDGRLKWIIDAYTVSDLYPYSEPFDGRVNYIRNSVKVVIDAYDGDVKFYAFDESDPLLASYRGIYPSMFTPLSEMPADIRAQMRYPEDLFNVQAQIYATYHMKDPQVFYNKEDLWQIPEQVSAGTKERMQAFYVVMNLPGETEPEYILMLPLVPKGKQNMIAWMAARMDGAKYGEIVVFKFPKEKMVYGPMQVEARIDQDPEISQRLTLWGQVGSSVIRGNLLVLPIEDSVIYIEPLYLQARDNKLPEFKRVIGVYDDKVMMEESLDRLLARMFGAKPEITPAPRAVTERPVEEKVSEDLIDEALRLYRLAQDRIAAGDWAGYGEAIRELGKVLERLSGNELIGNGLSDNELNGDQNITGANSSIRSERSDGG